MTWESALKIITAAVASAGGIGAIIIGVIIFSANHIAARLATKYQAKLDKEIEKYKSELNRKEYVTKTRFDTEFILYRELSTLVFIIVRQMELTNKSMDKLRKDYFNSLNKEGDNK